jgi:hypothetical protein
MPRKDFRAENAIQQLDDATRRRIRLDEIICLLTDLRDEYAKTEAAARVFLIKWTDAMWDEQVGKEAALAALRTEIESLRETVDQVKNAARLAGEEAD